MSEQKKVGRDDQVEDLVELAVWRLHVEVENLLRLRGMAAQFGRGSRDSLLRDHAALTALIAGQPGEPVGLVKKGPPMTDEDDGVLDADKQQTE
jgi:hypothetical protein